MQDRNGKEEFTIAWYSQSLGVLWTADYQKTTKNFKTTTKKNFKKTTKNYKKTTKNLKKLQKTTKNCKKLKKNYKKLQKTTTKLQKTTKNYIREQSAPIRSVRLHYHTESQTSGSGCRVYSWSGHTTTQKNP